MKKAVVVVIAICALLSAVAAEGSELMRLCESGTLEALLAFLSPDLNVRDERGLTPLMAAGLFNDNPFVADALLRRGALDPVLSGEALEALLTASGRFDDAQTLMNAAALLANRRDGTVTELLAAAAVNEKPGMLERYSRGADRRALVGALAIAAAVNPNPEAVKLLLERGADANAKNGAGYPPLSTAAAFTRNPETVRLLLGAGADPNAEGAQNSRPLLLAAAANPDGTVASLLIEAGADVNFVDEKTGITPLIFSFANPNRDLPALLIKAGADPSHTAALADMTTLMIAARDAPPQAVKALLKAGANPDARNTAGKTALDFAKERQEQKWEDDVENAEAIVRMLEAGR